MVQKLSFTANSVVLGTGNSRVILGADSGKLIVKDRHANTSTVQPGTGVIGATSVTTYANNSVLPMSPVSAAGALAYSSGNNTLFLSNGSGWYKITTVNQAPSITLSSTTATPTQSVLTLDFTYTTTEPEGTPVTVSLANSGIATVGNVAITHTTSNNHVRLVFDGTTVYTDATVTLSVTDGVNIGTGTITISTSYVSLDSRYTDVVFKADGNNKQNSTFTDGGGSNHSVTSNNDARLSSFTPFHPAGYSAYFDSASTGGNQIDAPASGNFLIGTGAFTLEAWIICDTKVADTYYRRIFSLDGPSGNSNGNLQMTINPSTGSIDMWSNTSDLDLAGTIAVDDGKWHHVAIVRSGTTITSYVDGRVNRSGTYSAAIGTHNSSQPRPRIGSYGGTNGRFKGTIHSLRLVVGTAVYTADFAPSGPLTNVTNTKLLMTLSPIPRDGSSSGHRLTQTGQGIEHKRIAPTDWGDYEKWEVASHGHSLAIGDTYGYLSHNDIGMSGLNDFTIEAWVYPTSGFKPWANCVYGSGNATSLASEFIYYGWTSNGTTCMFSNKSNNSTPTVEGSADDIVLEQWHHIAFVRASNQASIYVNGVKKAGPTSMTGTMAAAPTGRAYIGTQSYDPGNGNRTINGFISDFRIHNTCLYTNDFTPPTTKLTATSGTQYLMAAATPGIYDGAAGIGNTPGANYPLKLVGNTKSSTATKKYASSSMDFDGSGDYILFEHIGGLGDGDFTIEAWVYHDTLGTQNWFSQYRGSTGFNAGTDADGDFYWFRGSRLIDAAGVISATTWYHVAFVRADGVLRGYLNGVQKGSDVADTNNYSAKEFCVGSIRNGDPVLANKEMDGHIEDFRFTKGLARYPFIPIKDTLTTTSSAQNGITCTASNVKLLALTTATVTQDISSSNHTITNVNTVASSNFAPFSGMKSALFVAASNEKLTIPDGTWKTWGSNFTVECWIYANSYPHGTQNYIWGDYDSGGSSASTSMNLVSNNSGTLYLPVYTNGGLSTVLTSTVNMSVKKWYHVAVVRHSNVWYLFLNGSKVHERDNITTTINDSTQIFAIGGTGNFTGRGWDGYISNFRVNNAQALYTTNFTPPTSELY